MKLSIDRLTAARILLRVEQGAFSSRLLTGATPPAARVRVLEVLRCVRALDAVLEPLSRRPLQKLDAEVLVALRLGLVEIMRLETAPALATDGAVRLVRRLGRSSASGVVNAVLRKAAHSWRGVLERSAIDVQLSHPRWIFDRWCRRFGEEAAVDSMTSAQQRAKTWVWFRGDHEHRPLVGEGVELQPHPWCPGAWTAQEARRLIREVETGAAYAQDPSSQTVAHTALALAGDGQSFLDLCAAPGGKTALVAQRRSWARIVAADLRPSRARLIRSLPPEVSPMAVVAADATQPPFECGGWDFVLVDAPCTGSGTFRRHPELKWRLEPGSVREMADVQRKILESAMELVAPGGVLLYATCSVEPEENEGVVSPCPGDFELIDVCGYLPHGAPFGPTDARGARILPNPYGDGFTMHALRRI